MIKYEKVDLTSVRRALKSSGLPSEGTPNELVDRLIAHDNSSGEELAECDVCGAVSAISRPCCPICGSSDDAPANPEPNTHESKEADVAANKQLKTRTGKTTSKSAKSAKESKSAKSAKSAKEPKGSKSAKEDKPKARGVEKAEPASKTPKAAKAQPAPRVDVSPAKNVLTAPQNPEGVKPARERDLDRAIERIRKAQVAGTKALFEIGQLVIEIEEKGLYTLRPGDDGKPKYRTFAKFCEEELGFTSVYAQRLADISRRFNEEDVAKLGPTKLGLIVGVKPGAQADRLLEAARAGATVSSLSEQVRQIGGDDRAGPRRAGGRAEPRPRRVDVEPSEGLTVVHASAVSHMPLLSTDGKPTKRADGAIAREVAANGVVTTYTIIMNEDGHLSLKVERSR